MNKILIVDDNPKIRKMLQRHLIKEGYEMSEAENGTMALAEIEMAKPDLILLDIMMPGMDGLEVCKRLKQEPTTSDIPVIFLTAKSEKDEVTLGLELGAVDYVTKPFNTKELMMRVKTHIELKVARDTILLQREELKQANEELKQANAAKNKFFSILSHDLGNLFNVLNVFSLMLTKPTNKPGAEKKEELIKNLLQASQKGSNLLRNLLQWSQSQTGQIVSEPARFNLKTLVAENIDLSSSHAKAKNIELVSSISDTTSVFADKNMLDTVIRNLLSNAIKFTPANGRVEIVSKEKEKDTEVEISISDTGVGMSPQDIEKLFRVDVNRATIGTREGKGTGLGLILCKEFVEKNGGRIWVESEIGKGSRFYICLPSQ